MAFQNWCCVWMIVLAPLFSRAEVAARSDTTPKSVSALNAGWTQLPAILKRIVPPTFPTQRFSITNFGAIADGKANCSAAFKAAIRVCAESGGGKVIVPAGKFLTGP